MVAAMAASASAGLLPAPPLSDLPTMEALHEEHTRFRENPDWKFTTEVDGIKIFERYITGYSYKAFKGVGVIPCALEELRRVGSDVVGRPGWDENCVAAQVLRKLSDEASVERYVMVERMVATRDMILFHIERMMPDGTWEMVSKSVDDPEFPPRPGFRSGLAQ